MHTTTVVVVGTGHCGLAMSRHLAERCIDHVVLERGEIRSVVWATGIRADFSWVDVPVFDPSGRLKHEGGVMPWPGLYVIGMPLLRRRRSTFIDGAASDAADLAAHLAAHLDSLASANAS